MRGYLKALKPFLMSDDSLKILKLEWVFDVPEVVSKGTYNSTAQRYGLEVIDRINEEAIVYRSPILYGAVDDALIPQILKQRGRFDVQCISRLKELLSMMRKKETIARFVYHLPPCTYQSARFTDWVKPYIDEQLADPARQTAATNNYIRGKFALLEKAAAHYEALEPLLQKYEEEQRVQLEASLAGGEHFSDLSEHWVGATSAEVIRSYPPMLLVSSQIGEEREIFRFDDDPLVTVQVFELDCEYAYSAPTGRFNIQVPHIEARNLYQNQSYVDYKKSLYQEEEKKANADLEA